MSEWIDLLDRANIKPQPNLAGTTAPTVNNDGTEGYAVGSRWTDATNDKDYVCTDASTGAAVWIETTGSGTTPATTVATSDASAGVVGTDTTFAREDHEHQIVTTGTPGDATPGDTAAAGTSDSLVRLDHQHGLPAFGAAADTFAEGDDGRFPTTDEKAALAGTGTPAVGNPYVNDDDSRMTNARTPTTHASDHENAGGDEISIAGLSGEAADPQLSTIQDSTVGQGTAHTINFGTNLTATVATGVATVTSTGGTDATAIHTDGTAEIQGVTEETTPASGDLVVIESAANSYAKRRVQITNLPGDTGDVVGPAGGTTDGDVAVYDDTTGKLIRLGTVTESEIAANTTHISSAGTDHSDVGLNNTHRGLTNEHIDWSAGAAGTIHTDNYIEGGAGTDTTALHDNVGDEINQITVKGTPVLADRLVIEDSAASWAKKAITIASLPTGDDPNAIHDDEADEIHQVTLKGTPVAADEILIEDSAASWAKKRTTLTSLLGGGGGDSWGDAVDADIVPDTTNTYTLGTREKMFSESWNNAVVGVTMEGGAGKEALALGDNSTAKGGADPLTTALTTDGVIIASAATFTSDSVVAGDVAQIQNSAARNNGYYEILSVDSQTQITVNTTFTAEATGTMTVSVWARAIVSGVFGQLEATSGCAAAISTVSPRAGITSVSAHATGTTSRSRVINEGLGSMAIGYCKASGGSGEAIFSAASSGALAMGNVEASGYSGIMEANGEGAMASGSVNVWNSGTNIVLAEQRGSHALGAVNGSGEVVSTGEGGLAAGLAENGYGVKAEAAGTVAFGHASAAHIIASGASSMQVGEGTNSQATSLQVGDTTDGIRLVGGGSAPTTPHNGDIYCDGTDVFIRSGGAWKNASSI